MNANLSWVYIGKWPPADEVPTLDHRYVHALRATDDAILCQRAYFAPDGKDNHFCSVAPLTTALPRCPDCQNALSEEVS